jgi:hypothetical protein
LTHYCHIGRAVAKLKAAHAIAELIDFPDDVIARRERRTAVHGLRIEMAPDQHVGVLQTRGEHADGTSPRRAVGSGASTTSSPSGPPNCLT